MMTPHEQTTERKDPLIDEVRQVRQAINDRVNGDFDQLGNYLRKVGQTHRDKAGRFRLKPTDPRVVE